jgi:hypothetical protein
MADTFDHIDPRTIVESRFQPEGRLAYGWQHLVTGKSLCDTMIQPKPLQTGGSEKDCVVLTFVKLLESGIQVTANIKDLHVRPHSPNLRGPALRSGANFRSRWKFDQRSSCSSNQAITDIFSLGNSGKQQPVDWFGR